VRDGTEAWTLEIVFPEGIPCTKAEGEQVPAIFTKMTNELYSMMKGKVGLNFVGFYDIMGSGHLGFRM
jgi:hypothetical protein